MDITNIHTATLAPNLSEIEPEGQHAALDDILKSTLAEANSKANTDKASIGAAFDAPEFADPEKLVALQTKLSDYNIFISLTSTLTRKAVSAVETLVKAQ